MRIVFIFWKIFNKNDLFLLVFIILIVIFNLNFCLINVLGFFLLYFES